MLFVQRELCTIVNVDGAMIRCVASAPMTILGDLYAFLQGHHRCGKLDTGVEGDRVWMTCTCGAVINRDAHRD